MNRLRRRVGRYTGERRRRRARRNIVVRRVAVSAGDAFMGMDRGPPARSRLALILCMTLETNLRPLRRRQAFEAQNRARFLSSRGKVPAGWAVTFFAGLTTVNIVLEGLRVRLMAGRAQRVVVYVFRVGDLG
jgi:hypothetical protein